MRIVDVILSPLVWLCAGALPFTAVLLPLLFPVLPIIIPLAIVIEFFWAIRHFLIVRRSVLPRVPPSAVSHRCIVPGSRLQFASQICHGLLVSSPHREPLRASVLSALIGWWNIHDGTNDLADFTADDAQYIPRENILEWVAWAFFDRRLHEILTPTDLAELDSIIAYFEAKLRVQFNNDAPHDRAIRPIRLSLDPIIVIYKPLFFYAAMWATDVLLDRFLMFSASVSRSRVNFLHPASASRLKPCVDCASTPRPLSTSQPHTATTPAAIAAVTAVATSSFSPPLSAIHGRHAIFADKLDYTVTDNISVPRLVFETIGQHISSLVRPVAPFTWDKDVKLDYFYRPGKTRNADGLRILPLVFVHGIGLGTSHNVLLLRKIPKDIPLFLLKMPEFTLKASFVEEPDSILSVCKAIELMLHNYGHKEAVFAGHSLGSVVITWMCMNNPALVASAILLDPVCFVLYHYGVAKNFIYSADATGVLDRLIKYFVARDVNVAHYLGRHFHWSCNTMMWCDMPRKPHSANFIMVGEHDSIVPTERVCRYILHSMVEDMVLDEVARLGSGNGHESSSTTESINQHDNLIVAPKQHDKQDTIHYTSHYYRPRSSTGRHVDHRLQQGLQGGNGSLFSENSSSQYSSSDFSPARLNPRNSQTTLPSCNSCCDSNSSIDQQVLDSNGNTKRDRTSFTSEKKLHKSVNNTKQELHSPHVRDSFSSTSFSDNDIDVQLMCGGTSVVVGNDEPEKCFRQTHCLATPISSVESELCDISSQNVSLARDNGTALWGSSSSIPEEDAKAFDYWKMELDGPLGSLMSTLLDETNDSGAAIKENAESFRGFSGDYIPGDFKGMESKDPSLVGSVEYSMVDTGKNWLLTPVFGEGEYLKMRRKTAVYKRSDPLGVKGSAELAFCYGRQHGEMMVDEGISKLAIDAIIRACIIPS